MFQIGDKVICIDHLTDNGKPHLGLTYGKEYVKLRMANKKWQGPEWIHIHNDRYETQSYQSKRFVSLEQYRKMKIKKIRNV